MESNPFTKRLVFCYLFEQRAVLRIRAQTEFQKILRLRVLFVDAQVIYDIPALIELIGTVLVFGEFADDAAVDERGIGIVIARIGGIPLAVLEAFLLRLQFFCIPADVKAVT